MDSQNFRTKRQWLAFATALTLLFTACATTPQTVSLPPHGYAVLVKDPHLAPCLAIISQKYEIDPKTKAFVARTRLRNLSSIDLALEARTYFKDPLASTKDVSFPTYLEAAPGQEIEYTASSTNEDVVGFAVLIGTCRDTPIPADIQLAEDKHPRAALLEVDSEWLLQTGLTPGIEAKEQEVIQKAQPANAESTNPPATNSATP